MIAREDMSAKVNFLADRSGVMIRYHNINWDQADALHNSGFRNGLEMISTILSTF